MGHTNFVNLSPVLLSLLVCVCGGGGELFVCIELDWTGLVFVMIENLGLVLEKIDMSIWDICMLRYENRDKIISEKDKKIKKLRYEYYQ